MEPQTVWIIGKMIDDTLSQWEFQGVFDTEELAIAACVEDRFFVGPAEINTPFPVEPVKWVGAWYPRVQTRPEEKNF